MISNDHTNGLIERRQQESGLILHARLFCDAALVTFFLAFVVLKPVRVQMMPALSDSKAYP
jgi:hypothetical protein